MRKIAVVTGTRAEYGYLKPLMKAIDKDPDLELIPIITGMHLMKEYGNTYKYVQKDFPQSVKIPMQLNGDQLKDMAHYLSCGIKNFADYFSMHRPDVIVILGDRSESLSVALAGVYLNIPLAHINGGDVTGTMIDESIRHAITKLAHIHFAHTKSNAQRIQKMGEDRKRIFISGALTLDTILHQKLLTKKEIFKKYDLDSTQITFILMQHPITTLKDKGYSQIKELFKALEEVKKQTIVLYPNNDAGSKKFIELINRYEKNKNFHIFKDLPHEDFLSLMKSCDILIGNSSSGIIEAPSFKIPVINIGSRQQGRERSINVVDVEPKKEDILAAIDFCLHDLNFLKNIKRCKNKFGDGTAAKRIVKVLKELPITDELIQKQITY